MSLAICGNCSLINLVKEAETFSFKESSTPDKSPFRIFTKLSAEIISFKSFGKYWDNAPDIFSDKAIDSCSFK